MITEDLDAFLNDFGVPVVFGLVTGLGILDTPDEVLSGLSISTQYQLTVKASEFGDLTNGDVITVDSDFYKVREFKLIGDGKFGIAMLSETIGP